MNNKSILPIVLAVVFVCALSLLTVNAIADEQIVVIGWNAESGDANPDVVAERIEEIDGCDIWGMCEVKNSTWADQFEEAAEEGEGADFETVLGATGSNTNDLMQIIYDADRFELIDSYELHRINVTGTVRAPLVAHFRINGTDYEFLFMINHLYRSKAERRHDQARLLNRWAAEQTLPIIAVGDYNFDWDVCAGDLKHDKGYDEMVSHGYFNWVRPRDLKKTQASADYNSVLDFVFLGGNTWIWEAESTILRRDANDTVDDHFSEDNQTSDHRPVRATITVR